MAFNDWEKKKKIDNRVKPFFDQIERGNLLSLKEILKNPRIILWQDSCGITGFHLAAKSENKEVFDLFLEIFLSLKKPKNSCDWGNNFNEWEDDFGNDFTEENGKIFYNWSFFGRHKKRSFDNYETYDFFGGGGSIFKESKVDIDMADKYGDTPLYFALGKLQYSPEVFYNVEKLIANGANSNAVGQYGMNSLYQVIGTEKENTIIEYLVQKGANIEHRDTLYHGTPLLYAYNFRHTEAIRSLLALGAKIDVTDHEGNTCLHMSVHNRNYEVTEAILKKGLDVNIKNARGYTPLFGSSREIAQLFIDFGADINVTARYDEKTPKEKNIIEHKNRSRRWERIYFHLYSLLLERNCHLNLQDEYLPHCLKDFCKENEVLMGSITGDIEKISTEFTEEQISQKAKNSKIDAISFASARGHLEILDLLMQKANIITHDFTMALYLASLNSHHFILKKFITCLEKMNVISIFNNRCFFCDDKVLKYRSTGMYFLNEEGKRVTYRCHCKCLEGKVDRINVFSRERPKIKERRNCMFTAVDSEKIYTNFSIFLQSLE